MATHGRQQYTLHAWKAAAQISHYIDHTWVTSYLGPAACPAPSAYWYCGGNCYPTPGGGVLASGLADAALARCICTPDQPHQRAGIIYGVNGVCHQVTNRVLYSTVTYGLQQLSANHHIRGYAVTVFAYGDYGLGWFAQLQNCMNTLVSSLIRTRLPAVPGGKPMEDFTNLLYDRLGRDYDPERVARVRVVQEAFRRDCDDLGRRVANDEFDGVTFANALNERVNTSLQEIASILGHEDYRTVFETDPGEEVGLVDPETARGTNYHT